MVQPGDELAVSDDGVSLPAAEVLTGRGFVTGKSGSGKSNTASVFAEELLSLDARLLVIDTDGEYYGLKEEFEMLHVGDDDRCDVEVTPNDAEAIADLVVEDAVPVVVDISGFLEGDRADELVYEVAKHVFAKAGKVRQPCLMVVEEIHEFVPEQGGLSDVGEMIVRVAKRGRKRGLGLCGLSQRPAAVDKDFITQCDWLAWHRLTWANDTRVVKRVLGGDYADAIEDLDAGQAFLQTDWDESIDRVQFRRKHTFDAGATPGFGESRDPDLKPVPEDWMSLFGDDFERQPAPDDGNDEDEPADATSDDESDDSESNEQAQVDEDDGGESTAGADETDRPNSTGEPNTPGEPASLESWDDGGGASAQSNAPPENAHHVTWELGQLVYHVCRSAVRRTTAGLRGVGRRTRNAASHFREEVTGYWGDAPTGAGGRSGSSRRSTSTRRSNSGRGPSAASDGGIESADVTGPGESTNRSTGDLLVGGLVVLAFGAAVVGLLALA